MDIEKELNREQYLAASSDSQYLRIVAGAGTGKTRTLTYRIAYLITHGINPRRMAAFTFTKKAANEMKERVGKLLSDNDIDLNSKVEICTFHSFCVKFLRKEISTLKDYSTTFTIADEDDIKDIQKGIFKNMVKGESKEFTKAIIQRIDDLKSDGYFPEEVSPEVIRVDDVFSYDELMFVYSSYQHELVRQNMVDFDDLLMLTYKILYDNPVIRANWQSKYDAFLVDEFQDTNLLQYDIVRLFMKKDTKLTVVGDPDQTIYTWRGAKNEIISKYLKEDFKNLETVVLDKNYRSTKNILDKANLLIKNNHDRVDKDLEAANNVTGDIVSYNIYNSAEKEGENIARIITELKSKENINYSDVAIIYRSNYISYSIEKALMRYKVPYQVCNGLKFYDRQEIKDSLAYLRLLVNPDDFSFKRVLKAPTKSIGDKTLENAAIYQKSLPENKTLLEIFRTDRDQFKLRSPSIISLDYFYSAYDKMIDVYNKHDNNDELVAAIREYFENTGFFNYVKKLDVQNNERNEYTTSTSTCKMENVEELLRSLSTFLSEMILDDNNELVYPTLIDFLLSVAVQTDQDNMETQDKVLLMTGHTSKGLEFPYVFLPSLNQNVFPTSHALSFNNKAIEEERRLMYVCVTRARKKLYVSSHCGSDFQGRAYSPSMFIKEMQFVQQKPKVEQPNYEPFVGRHKPSANINSLNTAIGVASILKKAEKNDTNYVVGDKVVHTSFGIGDVIAVDGDRLTIKFKDEIGTKKMIAGFKAFKKYVPED